jgi:hypothetical protein
VFDRRVVGLWFLVLTLLACDPGGYYTPIGWKPLADGRWAFENSDIRVELRKPGNLFAVTWLTAEFAVYNLTDVNITLTGALLTSNGRTYAGSILNTQESVGCTIPAHGRRNIAIKFSFSRPLRDVLGELVELRVNYQVGTVIQRSLAISFAGRK